MARPARRPGMPYVPLDEAAHRPNVMADGAALPSTVLALSHWPASPTPRALRHDLSAGIGFRYMRSRRHWPRAEVSTTDHFDQDGLVTLLVLTDPDRAFGREARLMAVAEAGDFVRGHDRAAARVSFALAGLAESRQEQAAGGDAAPGDLHRAGLELLVRLVDEPASGRELWEAEDRFLSESEAAFATGAVTLSEVPALDLVVVEVLRPPAVGRAAQFSRRRDAAVHPMSVHNRSARTRVLVSAPPRYELYFRYETWVRLASRRPAPRVDVEPAAAELTALEPGGRQWSFTGAGATVARLSPAGDGLSELAPEVVRSVVERALAGGRPAWDPYGAPRRGGGS